MIQKLQRLANKFFYLLLEEIMKKIFLVVASAVLAISLIACANNSGGGKRAVTTSNRTNGEPSSVTLSEVSNTFFKDRANVKIDNNARTITFPGNGEDSGIMFGDNVEAIEFTMPADEKPLALTYLNSDIEAATGNANIIGFLLNRTLSIGGGNAQQLDLILKTNSDYSYENPGTNLRAKSIFQGGFGQFGANNTWTTGNHWYASEGDAAKLNNILFPVNTSWRMKIMLDPENDKVIITKLNDDGSDGEIWESNVVDKEYIKNAGSGLKKCLALSRHGGRGPSNNPNKFCNNSTSPLTLTDVKIYLKNK